MLVLSPLLLVIESLPLVVTKTITKGDKTRVKTRKKGGTGLMGALARRKARRAAKKSATKMTYQSPKGDLTKNR